MKTPAILFLLVLIPLSSMDLERSNLEKPPKQLRDNFALIPAMTFSLDTELDDSMIQSSTVSTSSFFCAKTEVSNFEYRTFLNDLKKIGQLEAYHKALWDSAGWREPFAYQEPFVQLYSNHPAYDRYPVVNVSHEGAMIYCSWLEDQLNKNADDLNTYVVSLPTRVEWIAAAKGGHDHSPYPWGGPSVMNAKGCLLANFKYVGAESVHFNPKTETYEIRQMQRSPTLGVDDKRRSSNPSKMNSYGVTAPVSSYFPNDHGLYNMSGNVAEMISEPGIACGGSWLSTGYDIRCSSTMSYETSQKDVGFRPIIRIVN